MKLKQNTTKINRNLSFMKHQNNREDHPYFQELRNPYPMKQQINNKCVTSSTTNVDNWIIEAKSAYNDGYTQLYYKTLLRDLKDRLNSLEFLNEYNHGEKNDK